MTLRQVMWCVPIVGAAGLGAWASQLASARGDAAAEVKEIKPAVTLP